MVMMRHLLHFYYKDRVAKKLQTYFVVMERLKSLLFCKFYLIFRRRNLQRSELRQEFLRLTKLVHPDKNEHPLANLAFQKLSEVFKKF